MQQYSNVKFKHKIHIDWPVLLPPTVLPFIRSFRWICWYWFVRLIYRVRRFWVFISKNSFGSLFSISFFVSYSSLSYFITECVCMCARTLQMWRAHFCFWNTMLLLVRIVCIKRRAISMCHKWYWFYEKLWASGQNYATRHSQYQFILVVSNLYLHFFISSFIILFHLPYFHPPSLTVVGSLLFAIIRFDFYAAFVEWYMK